MGCPNPTYHPSTELNKNSITCCLTSKKSSNKGCSNYIIKSNAQEKVDEPKRSEALEDPYQNKCTEKIAGKGNHNTAHFWVFDANRSVSKYDTKLGRRCNLDPRISEKPNQSSYSVLSGTPIWYKDILGDLDDYIYDQNGTLLGYIENDEPDRNFMLHEKSDYIYEHDGKEDGLVK